MTDSIYLYKIPLPAGIHEIVAPCSCGYTVYINDSISYDKQVQAYDHAIAHIRNDDWNREDVQSIEATAHDRLYIRPKDIHI